MTVPNFTAGQPLDVVSLNTIVEAINLGDSLHNTFSANPTITPSEITGTNVDWQDSGYQFRDIDNDVEFSFSNISEGRQLTVSLKSISASDHVITFPAAQWIGGNAMGITLSANRINVYTFLYINGQLIGTALETVY